MERRDYFNADGVTPGTENILGDNSTGIIDFNRPSHQWAKNIFAVMQNLTWFTNEVNTADERQNFEKLLPNEQEIYKRVFSQLSANDSMQTKYLVDFAKQTNNALIRGVLGRQVFEETLHCLIDGTEILTKDGFKDFKDLTYEDEVAVYHDNETITFETPKEIIHGDYDGVMYKFANQNYSYCQIVTPNHRIVKRNYFKPNKRVKESEAGKLFIEYAEDCSVRNYILPVSGIGSGDGELSIEDRIGIAIQADGIAMNKQWIAKKGKKPYSYRLGDGTYAYKLSLKREDKKGRLRALLDLAGLRYTVTKPKRKGYTNFYVWTNKKFDKEFDWVDLSKVNEKYGREFIRELAYWDGSISENESTLYTNTNKKAIDKVIAIATLSGHQTNYYRYKVDDRRKVCYQVHIVPNKKYRAGREVEKYEFEYNGKIHCVTVSTGMIVCRYKNSVFITGNSESYAVLLDNAGNSEEVMEYYRHNDMLKKKNEAIAEMFSRHINGNSVNDLVLSAIASANLEGIFFLTGFGFIHMLGDKVPGARDMIAFISRDEITSHLPIFVNIYKTLHKEFKVDAKITDKVYSMFEEAVRIELEFAYDLIKDAPLLGVSETILKHTVENFANDRMRRLGLKPIFDTHDRTLMEKLVIDGIRNINDKKTNFFEGNVTNYSKGALMNEGFDPKEPEIKL